MSAIKRLALRFLTNPVVLRGVEHTTRGAAAILTLHRFTAFGRSGHDPGALARNLEWLRRRRYRLVPLMALIDQVRYRLPASPRTVAFTVDDGYADFAEVAAPIFARYDCPVTVFLITGFLDGGLWLWWDRIRWAMEQTSHSRLDFSFPTREMHYSWEDPLGRIRASRDLIRRFKDLPNADREAAHLELERRLDVTLPAAPPTEFGPMTWDQVRTLGRGGVRFGPHTVTHPILARTSDEHSRREIRDSWARLSEQTDRTIPVFCWPNGDLTSFGSREAAYAAEAGMVAGLSTVQASFTRRCWTNDGRRYALPRYAYPQDPSDFAQVVSGLERLKEIARLDLTAR
ncbi:MAG TPA: polysaccharide deacetylase family protein [Gemmatimonadales bacterium]